MSTTLLSWLIVVLPILLIVGAIALARTYLSWPLESQILLAISLGLIVWRSRVS
ncbi:hypothetical protein LCGC14_1359700 [marine sediment metagenome]|uniref:Uncharacterized protein n=1 Tax=marine sediment metagenome TaxID=412755 RepID=A0A0F9K922_9ZZZZ